LVGHQPNPPPTPGATPGKRARKRHRKGQPPRGKPDIFNTDQGSQFGAIRYQGHRVTGFQEKPPGDGGWINGGFFVVSPEVGRYIEGDFTVWEHEPLEVLLLRERTQAATLRRKAPLRFAMQAKSHHASVSKVA
jgi:hypothetical protein